MLQIMTIAFREGMEAFLIVAISLAYLQRTGRPHLARPVYAGIAAALVLSAVMGVVLSDLSQNPMTESVLALGAGVMVGTFTLHMLRAAKHMGQSIRDRLESHALRDGFWASFGIFAFVALMITREGMETVLMMSAASYDMSAAHVALAVLPGLGLAALMAYFWVRKSHLIQIGRFLKVTAIFLIMFAAQMILKGLHELSETGAVPLLSQGAFHQMTETLAEDDGIGSQIITYALVAVPLGWLSWAALRDRMQHAHSGPAA